MGTMPEVTRGKEVGFSNQNKKKTTTKKQNTKHRIYLDEWKIIVPETNQNFLSCRISNPAPLYALQMRTCIVLISRLFRFDRSGQWTALWYETLTKTADSDLAISTMFPTAEASGSSCNPGVLCESTAEKPPYLRECTASIQ